MTAVRGPRGQPTPSQHRARLDQLLQAVHPDHAVLPEGGVHDRVRARQRAGVRRDRAGGGLAAAELVDDDGLAGGQRPVGDGKEAVGAADALQQGAEHPHLGPVHQLVEERRGVQHRLVADRDGVGEADAAGLAEAVELEQHGAALAEQRDAAGLQRRAQRQA